MPEFLTLYKYYIGLIVAHYRHGKTGYSPLNINYLYIGFLEKELKENDIAVAELTEDTLAPLQKEMSDIQVSQYSFCLLAHCSSFLWV